MSEAYSYRTDNSGNVIYDSKKGIAYTPPPVAAPTPPGQSASNSDFWGVNPSRPTNLVALAAGTYVNPVSSGTAEEQRAKGNALTNTDGSIEFIDPMKDENLAGIATTVEQARQAINTQTQADLDAINNAGVAAGGEYDPMIISAQEEQRTGMGKAIVTAGRRGGLENTQFSGSAAAVITPEARAAFEVLKAQGFDVQTPGNESWVGKGGELANIRDVYSANISKIQALQKQAIAAARSAAQKYQRDGKIENYNIAKDLYDQAKGLIKDSNDLKIQQKEMERNARNDAFTKSRAEIADKLDQDKFDFDKYKYDYEIKNPTVKTSWSEAIDSKDGLMHRYLVSDTGKIIQDLGATENLVTEMAKKYKDANIVTGAGGDTIAQATAKMKSSKIYQDEVRGPVGAGGDKAGSVTNFKFSSDQSSKLLGNGFSGSDISAIEQNIRNGYSIDEIISSSGIDKTKADQLRQTFSGVAPISDDIIQQIVDGKLDLSAVTPYMTPEQRTDIIGKVAKKQAQDDNQPGIIDNVVNSWKNLFSNLTQ